MPRYLYICTACEGSFEQAHSYRESVDKCALCKVEGKVQKNLSAPISSLRRRHKKSLAGEKVHQAIAAAKSEIKDDKKNLKKRIKK